MKQFLKLAQTPVMTTSTEFLEEIKEPREKKMDDEVELMWAIQDGDDADSRQLIPEWISRHAARFVFSWLDQRSKWQDLRRTRHALGKDLTACQKQQLDDLQKFGYQCKILFDKETKKRVTKIKTQGELKDASKKYFSMKITIDTQTLDFQIQAGNGDAMRLVLLQGNPVEDVGLPAFLDSGVAGDAEVVALEGEIGEVQDDCFLDGDEAHVTDMLEAEQLMEAAEDDLEFCGNTSDEEMMAEVAPENGFKRVKDFFHREAYKKLDAKGLALIPNHLPGVLLSFHKTTNTWQGYYPKPAVPVQMSFTFGGTTNRALSMC